MDFASWTEIGVFPEEACVFFVDADGVFDVDCVPVVAYVAAGLFTYIRTGVRRRKEGEECTR